MSLSAKTDVIFVRCYTTSSLQLAPCRMSYSTDGSFCLAIGTIERVATGNCYQRLMAFVLLSRIKAKLTWRLITL
jgi:hypothetical protein